MCNSKDTNELLDFRFKTDLLFRENVAMIPYKDEEDPNRFALDAAAHRIPYAFATADLYQAAQSTCFSCQDQRLRLSKAEERLSFSIDQG